MKKIIVIVFVLIVLVSAIAYAAATGITPGYLRSAPGVASGMGAKLLCSARYVSGFSAEQSFDDLVQYSPVLQYLNVDYDDKNRKVRTSLFGLAPSTASYYPGVGCYTDYEGFTDRADASIGPMPEFTSRWPHGSRVETINSDAQALLDELVATDNNLGLNTRALLVVREGHIIAESYAQGAAPDTPLLGWSMTKSLVAVMLGNLEYRGLLNVDETPGFSRWSGDSRSQIRIRDLLTMTDGLTFSEAYDPGDDATAMLFTQASTSAYAIGRDAVHRPGSWFNYSSGTASILSRIYFDRTGGTLADSLEDYRRNIAVPLSFQHSIFEPDARGVLVGSSYLYASARDWARVGQMMLNGGVLNGHRIVSTDWVQRATRPNSSENGKAYGYQWWLNSGGATLRWPDLPEDAYAAVGNRQQSMMILPSHDVVIVRMGWTSGIYPTNERFATIIDALR